MGGRYAAVHAERLSGAGEPRGLLAALLREAAHLTRRDGRKRYVVEWPDAPPEIADEEYDDFSGPQILAYADLA